MSLKEWKVFTSHQCWKGYSGQKGQHCQARKGAEEPAFSWPAISPVCLEGGGTGGGKKGGYELGY